MLRITLILSRVRLGLIPSLLNSRVETVPHVNLPGRTWAVFFSIFLCSHSLLILSRIRHAPSPKAKFGPGARSILVAGSLFLWSLVLVSALFGYAGIGVLPDWTYYLGLSLSVLGNAIWFWGYQTLGRFYSQALVIY